MKKYKKIVSALLSIMLIFCLNIVIFAEVSLDLGKGRWIKINE